MSFLIPDDEVRRLAALRILARQAAALLHLRKRSFQPPAAERHGNKRAHAA